MSDDSVLDRLAEEFIESVRAGKRPEIEDYALRFPDLAGRVRVLFPTLLLLEGKFGDNSLVDAVQRPCPEPQISRPPRSERQSFEGRRRPK